MNPKYLLAAVVSTALLFSCSTKKTETPEPGNGKKVPVTVNVEFPDALTRAVSFPGSNGVTTDEEKHLTNVAVFIFNNQRLLEAYADDDNIRNGGFANSITSFQFEVSVGRHYIFAVGNVPKDYLNYATEGISIDEFSEEIFRYNLDVLTGEGFFNETMGSEEQLGQQSRGFFMTSKGGMNEFWAQDTDDVTTNTADIELVRAVAKVAVAFDPESQTDGELINVEYQVDHNPKAMYVVERYNGTAVVTPSYSNNTVDPNNYQEPLHDFQPVIMPGMAPADKTWTYAMENSNFIPKEGNATVAMIRGNFVPEKLLDADGQSVVSTPVATDGPVSFWRIATTKNGLRAYDDGYYASKPVDALLTPQAADETKEAVYFDEGECYYPVWLRNPNSGNENQYTVKRNSYYKLTINSVTGAGGATPDETIDPEIPLDKQVNMVVNISVTNWNTIDDSQDI